MKKNKKEAPKQKKNKKEPWLDEPSAAEQIAASAEPSIKKMTEKLKKQKHGLSVEETKLGVTMVLSKEDVTKLGLSLKLTTAEVIKHARDKLGLEPRKRDK